ncbi:MAG: PD-(D/E)XK nuclease family transposase, partial [Taibaiella sp.]|nr:PD-(D/E)XK nuclease family transposase [Taibaiella sp.]
MPRKNPPQVNKYIDLLTDFGFKRIFGSEPNKDLLIDLLNSVLSGRKHIVSLEYNKNEHTADSNEEGSAIFDLSCTGEDGEKFIIEVQRGRQGNFKQRAIFYTSVLAAAQAPKGNRKGWAYQLPEIYFIALLEDFSVDANSDGRYVQDICLANRNTGTVFYEGLSYIFLELVNFAMREDELKSDLDKWLYVLKNISRMDKMPLFTRKTIFEKVFSIAEYVNMSKEEKTMYNSALKRKWDNQNVLDYA